MRQLAIAMDELVAQGLCTDNEEHLLTSKGRDLLQLLEELRGGDRNEVAAEDLILSTSGLIR